jgi:heat shock protein HslJ
MRIGIGRRTLVGLAVVGLVFVSACGDDDDDSGAAPSAGDLDGRTFTASDSEGFDLVDGSTVTITFTGDQIAVVTGCNTLAGGYSVENGTLTTGDLASTLKACEGDLSEQETWISDLVTSGPSIELDGAQLVLSKDGDSITLEA